MSLRLRLALAGAFAILAALGLAALGLAQLFGAHVERRAVAEMTVQLDQVLAALDSGAQGLTVARPPADPRFAQPYGGLYWQIDGPEGVQQRSRSLWDYALDLPADTLGDGAVHVHRLPGPEGATLLVLERSVTLPARLGGGAARAAVAMEAAELDAARRAFMSDLAPYLGVLALVLTGAGWAQLWVGLRPLARLGGRVAALRAGRAERMGRDWPHELRPVASEIDALLAARAAETSRARARAADLAHGLKTPLQALMGEAARLRGAGAETQADGIEDTARAMRRIVDRELARTRTAARTSAVSADAATVANRLVAVLRRTPDGGRLDWQVIVPAGSRVALDEADLSEALGALAENAARHARSRVTLSARAEDGLLLLSVTDDGPGIPPGRCEALTARHGRADETGTGLGLSIAAQIAEAAEGQLTLEDAGPGLTATLVLPRRAGPDA
ncbi:HAMP domain-containing histidine kinase [Lutimaribacter sp. EGI FJ00015]|uniref:HAMP domain-containing histidine kinase n=1 Tax=Lutimaribacter degradans TaxID=2945989 RepID=A0ACC5ZVY1_9RHOB|nr:HAMP domain-containing sensor histidine kinase [Lutimaribacter sp. EGI FJ00013]MCM2562260.1 HAMP domain-containing histidine kinase [Lutimaribacter sp. EGI FJ00013]MCO0613415.1 HAMP domain-containing histidine kinase [Lutimaribacter sp. EGI FJ00015]MCO0636389.1 HAMP domain-containing histidine kinase [Lutimaribacter sp. EGI FJ00014]